MRNIYKVTRQHNLCTNGRTNVTISTADKSNLQTSNTRLQYIFKTIYIYKNMGALSALECLLFMTKCTLTQSWQTDFEITGKI